MLTAPRSLGHLLSNKPVMFCFLRDVESILIADILFQEQTARFSYFPIGVK